MAKKFNKPNVEIAPELQFISKETIEAVEGKQAAAPRGTEKAPEGYKVKPEFIETKSKRVQLLLQPSTVEAIKSLASKKGLSMNEAINEAIQEYLHKED